MSVNFDAFKIAKNMINEKISIPTYYTDYVDRNVNLESYNRDCCPLHDEDSPSFFYFEDSKKFHCFGCDKTGYVTDLHYWLQLRLNPSYTRVKAVLDLAKLYKIDIPNIFKEVTLDTSHSDIFKTNKIPFKKKEELVKPIKKLKVETESLLAKNKVIIPTSVYMERVSELDSILFRNADVETELVNLNSLIREDTKKYTVITGLEKD